MCIGCTGDFDSLRSGSNPDGTTNKEVSYDQVPSYTWSTDSRCNLGYCIHTNIDVMSAPIPHIEVKIEYNGETVSQQCTHFIDGISFLCQAEAAIRRNAKMNEPVDNRTSIIQKENMKKLLGATSQ